MNFTVAAAGQTLFTTQTPAVVNANDGTNYELGTSFTSDTAGYISALRFCKGSLETGTHVGRIWSATGQQLASTTFAGETAAGWQQQSLSPLAIAANTTYIVSVNTGAQYYVGTNSGLATQIVNQHLRSVVGNNGLYGASGQFPTNSYQSSNYFRDIVFSQSSNWQVSGSIIPATAGNG